jgi:hypothetical protein
MGFQFDRRGFSIEKYEINDNFFPSVNRIFSDHSHSFNRATASGSLHT